MGQKLLLIRDIREIRGSFFANENRPARQAQKSRRAAKFRGLIRTLHWGRESRHRS